jgi:thiol-disulfide isomerase/thioredoxin
LRTLLILAGAVVLVIVLATKFYSGGKERGDFAGTPAMLAGAPATSFPIRRIDGAPDALDRYRGKVVLVNLWATWCPPCREEMPALERLYRELAPRGFVVLGIDQGESATAAAQFGRKLGVTFPLLLDDAQQYGRAYAAQGLPTTIVVDRGGRIVKGIDGALTLAQMRAIVTPILRAK